MNIFFSGIGGVGLGPLAQLAHDAGHTVCGTDAGASPMAQTLTDQGITVHIGQNDGFFERMHQVQPFDLFVYTAALQPNHPELVAAQTMDIKTVKRDELLAQIIKEKNLKLIAISGTHGKTTTTGMLVWAFKQLGIPVSYSIGTTINFGPSGHYNPASEYFVYECDEFDRNFLHFTPVLSLLTSLGYDHSDTYPTKENYRQAFATFLQQSAHTIGWQHDLKQLPELQTDTSWRLQDDEVVAIKLAGQHNRLNASLVLKALEYLGYDHDHEPALLESFPGTNRRFERLGDNLYSDYGHHPTEIAATLQMAREVSDRVVLVYQPHQNIRQHEIMGLYRNCFKDAEKVYWLPTYLSREDPNLAVLTPQELISDIANKESILPSDMTDELWTMLELHRANGDLVLIMGAGSIDGWIRSHLTKQLA